MEHIEHIDILSLLTRSGTYILAVAVFVSTYFIRKIIEIIRPGWKKMADANDIGLTYLSTMARWWNEVILYAIPVVLGAMSSLFGSALLFGGLDAQAGMMFGAGVGWFSSFLYKALKKAVSGRLGVDAPSSLPPEG